VASPGGRKSSVLKGKQMRDLTRAINHIERTMTRGLERPTAREKPYVPARSPTAWRAPATDVEYPERAFKPKDKSVTRLTVTARAIKVTVPLDPAVVATLPTPDGQARSELSVSCDGKLYAANVATKSLRKVKATIAANGAENVFVMLQGKLRDSEIAECGIVAQVKKTMTP
jgi:hypothetical protein